MIRDINLIQIVNGDVHVYVRTSKNTKVVVIQYTDLSPFLNKTQKELILMFKTDYALDLQMNYNNLINETNRNTYNKYIKNVFRLGIKT